MRNKKTKNTDEGDFSEELFDEDYSSERQTPALPSILSAVGSVRQWSGSLPNIFLDCDMEYAD